MSVNVGSYLRYYLRVYRFHRNRLLCCNLTRSRGGRTSPFWGEGGERSEGRTAFVAASFCRHWRGGSYPSTLNCSQIHLANTASKFCSVRRVSFETSIHAGGAVVEATRRLPFCTQRRPSTSAAMPPRLCSHPSNCAKFWCGIGEVFPFCRLWGLMTTLRPPESR
jgi:hypothetical protein